MSTLYTLKCNQQLIYDSCKTAEPGHSSDNNTDISDHSVLSANYHRTDGMTIRSPWTVGLSQQWHKTWNSDCFNTNVLCVIYISWL